jgi:UDP-N-acetylglucosamine 2-epimerase
MTPRDQDDPSLLPELLVIVASLADASALAPLGHPDVHTPAPVRPVLVATGPDPMEVDEALDDADAPAGRVLVVDDPAAGPSRELALLLPRLDDLLADALPAGLVVRGGSAAALAAVHAAVARRVPVVHLPVTDVTGVESAQ